MNNTEHLLKQLMDLLDRGSVANQAEGELTTGIPVGVSNRHIHLSQADIEQLFGSGYQLTKLKDLKQPGQYAAKETLTIAGPKGSFSHVRVLGPARSNSQIEISKSDGFTLGIKAPVRESGDLRKAATLTVIGPKGSVIMESKVIVAKRHIHMTPSDASRFSVSDKEVIWIKTQGERKAILGDVVIRVNEQFQLECHLDIDEANSVSLGNDAYVEIYKPN